MDKSKQLATRRANCDNYENDNAAEKGRALKPLLHALCPTPLENGQYDLLAALLY